MALFRRSVSDEEWFREAKPLYNTAVPLMKALNDAVSNSGSIEAQINSVWDGYTRIHMVAAEIAHLPRPTSPEVRLIDKSLKSAIQDYIIGVETGVAYLNDLNKGAGLKLEQGGTSGHKAARKLTRERENFEGLIRKAQEGMKQVDAYFSSP